LLDKFADKGKITNTSRKWITPGAAWQMFISAKGFLTKNNDFKNAVDAFQKAKKYAPAQKQINSYIAYANNKLGNLQDAAKYYSNLISTDSTKIEYLETASTIYKSLGDTAKALANCKKGRGLYSRK
jgi:tetratricopeptide (TPR) repeat protein